MTATMLFVAAVVMLFVAHVVRAMRHALLFPEGDAPERFNLLLGLSLSYAVNTLVPFRVGELVRVLFIAVRLRLRASYVAATVLAERLSDVVVVATCMVALSLTVGRSPWQAVPLIVAAVVVVGIVGVVRRSKRARQFVWRVAGIFNETIRIAVLEFLWTAGQLVREGQLFRPMYLLTTVGMWLFYLTAYELFAEANGLTLVGVSASLLGAPLQPLVEEVTRVEGISRLTLAYLIFTSVPVAAIIAYGYLRQRREIQRVVRAAKRIGLGSEPMVAVPTSHRFRETSDYGVFLRAHFSTADQIVSRFVVDATEDAIVHRLLPGGSDALTAIVEVKGTLGIRKFAIGDAGEKLQVQAQWLRDQQEILPLAQVVGEQRSAQRYQYDMPYVITARDFYDIIHTAPLRHSMDLLREVIVDVDAFHRRGARGDASDSVVDAYLSKKALANARTILDHARGIVGDEYVINGEAYALADWDHVLDMDWLRAQVHTRDTSVIHGDLTIENIIVCPEYARGWYIIDPNPDNVFNSPLIDWAKMMQSLNLGYEGLNRGVYATSQGDGLRVPFTKSNAYVQLHTLLSHMLARQLGAARLREVAFHELVNYLRLTPYKFRHNPPKGVTFFACTSILLRRYLDGTGAVDLASLDSPVSAVA